MLKIITAVASLALAALTTATATHAAEIWRDKTAIFIKGDIVNGDFDRLKNVVGKGVPRGFPIVMKSKGGALLAGLDIGIAIRNLQLKTVVVDECYSVCALMWLAGVRRFAFSDAEIGFHGAYDMETHVVSGAGNAVVGAYLAKLGFSYVLIAAMTEASPDEVNLLNFAKASKMGISMTVLPTQRKKAAAAPATEWCPTCAPGARNLPGPGSVPHVSPGRSECPAGYAFGKTGGCERQQANDVSAPRNSDGTRRWPSQDYRSE